MDRACALPVFSSQASVFLLASSLLFLLHPVKKLYIWCFAFPGSVARDSHATIAGWMSEIGGRLLF